ncbi:hypothetical protein PUN28_011189 [Cardiocondyla obscurior]|uniref:Uncharacterized protein n=1 Tax=Cardiocondyla obscurior TaxID=286306 RepID=A0AAW2FNA7_9HYME
MATSKHDIQQSIRSCTLQQFIIPTIIKLLQTNKSYRLTTQSIHYQICVTMQDVHNSITSIPCSFILKHIHVTIVNRGLTRNPITFSSKFSETACVSSSCDCVYANKVKTKYDKREGDRKKKKVRNSNEHLRHDFCTHLS